MKIQIFHTFERLKFKSVDFIKDEFLNQNWDFDTVCRMATRQMAFALQLQSRTAFCLPNNDGLDIRFSSHQPYNHWPLSRPIKGHFLAGYHHQIRLEK